MFLPYCAAATSLTNNDAAVGTNDGTTTAFFTEMANRGLQNQTNWTAATYKTLLSVTGAGLVYCVIGCTAGGAENTTFEFTVDGVLTTVLVTGLASGERAALLPGTETSTFYTTAGQNTQPGVEALDADKATFGAIKVGIYIPYWGVVSRGIPMLKFNQSLLIRAKHSANITNSTATAYSAVMYRNLLAA